MKGKKKHTRPKDRRVEIKCEDGERTEKSVKEAMTKIVIRRLPPSLTKEDLEEQLQPLPEVDYLEFFANDTSLYPHLFARAYINFKNQEDIMLFRDRFDGYVFIDGRGQEYPAIVEFAPFQKTAKRRSKKKDAKSGTIDDDPDYKKFLEYYNGDEEKLTSTPETLLEELEAKSKELIAKRTTPLLDFLKNKQRIREEKKEERRRRELERKRLRDEERRKWREDERRKRKEAEKTKKLEKDQVKDEPKIKLLKKPERGDEADSEKPTEKPKRPERPSKEERPSSEHKRRTHMENKEERGRRGDEEGWKEFRVRDADREKELRQREERLRRRDENRRRKKERQDREKTFRKREQEVKKEKFPEKKKSESTVDLSCSERPEKPAKDDKKEESGKRERLRNKDRPAIQLYQPGARSRNRAGGGGGEEEPMDRKQDTEAVKGGD
uniref:UPF3 domain-containing protein n=1 Tax=Gouania willdenowi TaxID=441366 RepID=A0A8C5NBC2_GOUWI